MARTKTPVKTITLENCGPVKHLEIPIPVGGGLVVLRGRNGSGKSIALGAVETLVSGRGKVPVRDNSIKAEVEGVGAKLTVGKSSRRTGELEVVSLEGRLDVSTLVDPGLKDDDAADAKRIRALIALTGQDPDPALFQSLFDRKAGYKEALANIDVAGADLVTLADRFKRFLEGRAREVARQAEVEQANAKALEMQVGELPEDAGWADIALLRSAYETAVVDRRLLENRAAEQQKLAKAREAAQAQLTELEAGEAVSLEDISQRMEKAMNERNAFITAQGELEQRLAEMKRSVSSAQESVVALVQEEEKANRRDSLIKPLRELLAQTVAEAVTTPQIEAANVAVSRKSAELQDQIDLNRRLHLRKQAAEAMAAATELQKAEQALRDAAKGTDQILSEAVQRAGTPLTVDAGRLVTTHAERGATLFSELSHGERWHMAFSVAIKAVGVDGLLTLRQEAYEGLDPKNRESIAEQLKAAGVVCLTAACDGGDLRAKEV